MVLLKRKQKLFKPLFQLNSKHLTLRDANVFTIITTLNWPTHIHIILPYNPQYNVTRTDTFCTLSRFKPTCSFDILVDVLYTDTTVRYVIMSYIIYVMFVEEVQSDDPRTWAYYFVNPLAVKQNLGPFLLTHHDFSFFCDCFFITWNTYDQMNVFEKFFGLFKDFCMADVVHVKYAISINPDRIIRIISFSWINLNRKFLAFLWRLSRWFIEWGLRNGSTPWVSSGCKSTF